MVGPGAQHTMHMPSSLEHLYSSPALIRDFLHSRGLRLTKQFGQNFLISPSKRRLIIDEADLDGQNLSWEVGAGIGSMTFLAKGLSDTLVIFELDHGFCRVLEEFFSSTMVLVEGDVLKTWNRTRETRGMPDRIFGNLPYTVGSRFIGKIIEAGCLPERMVFTLQKEVVERMKASEGSKIYSSFSLLCQLDYRITHVCTIPPSDFFPKPEIDSAVVRMDRRETPLLEGRARNIFFIIIRAVFSSRRKMLRNTLAHAESAAGCPKELMAEAFRHAGISEQQRPEQVSLEAFADASRRIADSLQD